jgi:hypothetical protein
MRLLRMLVGGALLAFVLFSCQEKLTAPADCPALCPGGYEMRDTVLIPVQDGDSSYDGFIDPGAGASIRVSNGLPASEDRGVFRFNSRPDSVLVSDTLRSYTIDSAAIELSVLARDPSVTGLKVFLYRVPATIDTPTTFAAVSQYLIPANLIDSLLVDDTSHTQRLRVVFSDTTLYKVDIPAVDSGVLAVGLAIAANGPTGVRIGTINSGSDAPFFTTYAREDIPDTTKNQRTLPLNPKFSTFVQQNPPVPDPDILAVGGAPSSRALIRFDFPTLLRDSALLVRATLQLVPTAPLNGLPGDSTTLQARIILSDLGAKSVLSQSKVATTKIVEASTDTVSMEVVSLLPAWQSVAGIPFGINLGLVPEASSFTRATFGSTRTPGKTARLKLTYAVPFRFARP